MANRDVRQSKRVKRVPDRLGHSATSNDIEAAMFENSVEVSTEVRSIGRISSEVMETTEHSEQPEHADAMDITPALAERPSSSTQAPSLESSEGGFGLSRKRPREDSDGTYSMPSHKESSSLASDEVNQHDLMTPQPIEKVASLTQPPLQFDYELHYDSKRKPRVRSPPKKKKKDDNGYVPAGEPPVWSESRQLLCETLPYYNSYKASAYSYLNLTHGFLLADDSVHGTYIDSEVVITRAAGHLSENKDGEMSQSSHHTADQSSVVYMQNNMQKRVPIVLLVDKDNEQMPAQLKHNYSVLDHFQVTDIWPDKNGAFICYRFRLEKINLNEKSWWAKPEEELPQDRDFDIKAPVKECPECKVTSKQRYVIWMCANSVCSKFHKLPTGKGPQKPLAYHKTFLKERTLWPSEIIPSQPLVPIRFQGSEHNPSVVFTKAAWRGIVCPDCNACVGRIDWDKWVCSTPGCNFSHKVPRPVVSAYHLDHNPATAFNGTAIPMYSTEGLNLKNIVEKILGNWRVTRFQISPGNFVYHFQSNKELNAKPDGPDTLFKLLQEDENEGLKRRTVGHQPIKTVGWSKHFAKNFGLPYKYIMALESHPFSEAAPQICSSLRRMQWAKKLLGSSTDKEFNELLLVGYFDKGKMSYHDDGEDTLGPTIATMSLGSPAEMTIRMKSKYYSDPWLKGNTYKATSPVIPGCALEDERRHLNNVVAPKGEPALQKEFKKIKAVSKMAKKLKKEMPPLLTMHLMHGDIVIMDGHELQKYYEHSIVPDGGLRFALTCRHILPAKIPQEHHHLGYFDTSTYPEYNGDLEEHQARSPIFEAQPV